MKVLDGTVRENTAYESAIRSGLHMENAEEKTRNEHANIED